MGYNLYLGSCRSDSITYLCCYRRWYFYVAALMSYRRYAHKTALQGQLTAIVKREMKTQGLSTLQLAEKAHCNVNHLYHIFNGHEAGSIQMWDHLLQVLGIKLWQSPPTRNSPIV